MTGVFNLGPCRHSQQAARECKGVCVKINKNNKDVSKIYFIKIKHALKIKIKNY